jgi:hypothetical protein
MVSSILSAFEFVTKSYATIPVVIAWYTSGTIDINQIQRRAYATGEYISGKCRLVPGWDSIIEPLLISQLARMFMVGHAFTQGLTSDNTNVDQITRSLVEMRQAVSNDLTTPIHPE